MEKKSVAPVKIVLPTVKETLKPVKTTPPAAPNPEKLCFVCFIGESNIHWQNGVNELASWLMKNPDYNLVIKADGGTFHIPFTTHDTWNDHPTLNKHGNETIYDRLYRQFGALVHDVIKASGGKVDNSRLLLQKGTPEGRQLQYQVRRK